MSSPAGPGAQQETCSLMSQGRPARAHPADPKTILLLGSSPPLKCSIRSVLFAPAVSKQHSHPCSWGQLTNLGPTVDAITPQPGSHLPAQEPDRRHATWGLEIQTCGHQPQLWTLKQPWTEFQLSAMTWGEFCLPRDSSRTSRSLLGDLIEYIHLLTDPPSADLVAEPEPDTPVIILLYWTRFWRQ